MVDIEATPLDQLHFGSVKWDDAESVLELMRRCEIAEYGEHDSDMADLKQDWGQMDFARDAWLVLAPGDRTLGYAGVSPKGHGFQLDFYVDPLWRSPNLAQELVRRALDRLHEMTEKRRGLKEIVVTAYVAHVNERDTLVVKAAGFACVEHHFQMQARMDRKPPFPNWPDGIHVRTAVPGSDDRKIHDVIQRAFREPGQDHQPFQEWKPYMMGIEIFDRELWFLAQEDGQLVGACLCFSYPDLGWVRQLGVLENWRKRGIGSNLLRHSFLAFFDRGFRRVGLGVRAKNEDALHVYERAGMKVARQYDQWNLKLESSGLS